MTPNVTRLAQDALAHQHAGRIETALAMFSEVLRHDPRNPQAHFSLGIGAYQAGNIDAAIVHLQAAASKVRKHPQVHQLLGLALMNAGDLTAARNSLQKAVSLASKNADLHAQLGDLYRLQRKPVLARQSLERALKLDPENGYGLVGLGQLEVSLGNVEEAESWFEKAIALGKELPAALHRLAFTRTHAERPDFLDKIEQLVSDDAPLARPEKSELHWAAGKVYFDLGDTPHAAEHYRTARRIRYDPFDQKAYDERLAFMKALFTEGFFAERSEAASESEKPLFIFGMPRSGTTLAEQIVARHSAVASGGELGFFRQTQQELGLMGPPSPALESRIRSLGPSEYARIARAYLKELDAVDKRALRVTDKMPHNFEMLWLMSLLYPKATFVHCVRSPADTCVSLLSHALSPAHNYCRTQESVGTYFQSYVSLMDHWKKVLPVNIHTLTYEDLVYDQEGQSKALVEAAGLDWQAVCMEFYNGDSPVTTFSDLQVRRPIFRSSIGRWKRHKDLLPDLFEALGPLAPEEVRKQPKLLDPVESVSMGRPDNDHHLGEALQSGKTV